MSYFLPRRHIRRIGDDVTSSSIKDAKLHMVLIEFSGERADPECMAPKSSVESKPGKPTCSPKKMFEQTRKAAKDNKSR
jgi:hypothetical protein